MEFPPSRVVSLTSDRKQVYFETEIQNFPLILTNQFLGIPRFLIACEYQGTIWGQLYIVNVSHYLRKTKTVYSPDSETPNPDTPSTTETEKSKCEETRGDSPLSFLLVSFCKSRRTKEKKMDLGLFPSRPVCVMVEVCAGRHRQ